MPAPSAGKQKLAGVRIQKTDSSDSLPVGQVAVVIKQQEAHFVNLMVDLGWFFR